MATATVNEQSTAYLTVSFLDGNGNAEAPTAVSYRVDDGGGTAVRAVTALTPATSIEITLTPTDNTMVNSGRQLERRRVTVEASYGASDGVNDEYIYIVKNLAKVS